MRSSAHRTRSLDRVPRRVAWFLIALCAWTLSVWITRVVIIAGHLDRIRSRRRLPRLARPAFPLTIDPHCYGLLHAETRLSAGRGSEVGLNRDTFDPERVVATMSRRSYR